MWDELGRVSFRFQFEQGKLVEYQAIDPNNNFIQICRYKYGKKISGKNCPVYRDIKYGMRNLAVTDLDVPKERDPRGKLPGKAAY
jgi:hypothetical protein